MKYIYKGAIKILPIFYFMHLFSLNISRAGIEIFGWGGVLLVTFIGIYKYVVYKENIYVSHPLHKWFAIIAIAMIISIITAPEILSSHKSKWFYIGEIRNLIFFIYHLIVLSHFFNYKKALKTILYFMLPIALYAVLQKFTGFNPIKGEWSMTWDLNNLKSKRQIFDIYLIYVNVLQYNFFVILSFIILSKLNKKLKIFLTILAILFLISFIFSGSRAILIAILGGLFVQTLVSPKKLVYISLGILLILGIFISYKTSPLVKIKIDKTIEDQKKVGDKNRYYLWKTHLAIFKKHPIKGVGYLMNGELTKVYYKKINPPKNTNKQYTQAHNTIINMLAGTGLLGTIPLLIIWFLIFRITFQAFKMSYLNKNYFDLALTHGFLGGFTCMMITELSQTWFIYENPVTQNMFVFLAMTSIIWFKNRGNFSL